MSRYQHKWREVERDYREQRGFTPAQGRRNDLYGIAVLVVGLVDLVVLAAVILGDGR